MEVDVRYGRTGLTVHFPDGVRVTVLRMNSVAPVADVGAELDRALAQPIESPPLRELARSKKNACVVVSDVTRPVPNRVLLPPLLHCLETAGIPGSAITLLIATGLHRPNEGEELAEMIGDELARNYTVVNHHAREPEEHTDLGPLPDGAPVLVDRRYVEADLKIVTGLVEPHLMAGYSGGRKIVCPGLCGAATIRHFHSPALLEHERATYACMEGNPVHEMALAVARRAGVDFALNVTLDERRNITGIYAGNVEASHLAATAQVDRMANVPIHAPSPVVVTSSAGYPLDTTFYQSIKGLVGALPAVEHGGRILIASSLTEGLGGPEFTQLVLETQDIEEFMHRITETGFFAIDQWQWEEFARVVRKARVSYFSEGLPAETLKQCLVEPLVSIEEGLADALKEYGSGMGVTVIPEGPYVVPVLT